MTTRVKHPESETAAQQMLEGLGCSQSHATVASRRLLPVTLLLFSACVISAALWFGPWLEERKLQLDIGNLVIAIGLTAAVVQWRAAIDQQSMEKYEGEIATSNEFVAKNIEVLGMMVHHYPILAGEVTPDYARCRYVYVHLDNLEYALERYLYGLASAYATARAVMTFENCCESLEFRQRVQMQITAASYSPVVQGVVEHLLRPF